MALKNYICSKCGTHVTKDSQPSNAHCKKGDHKWYDVGEVGSKEFQCNKCSTVVHVKSQPNAGICFEGGDHKWHQL